MKKKFGTSNSVF